MNPNKRESQMPPSLPLASRISSSPTTASSETTTRSDSYSARVPLARLGSASTVRPRSSGQLSSFARKA